jgi:hypothetical protein
MSLMHRTLGALTAMVLLAVSGCAAGADADALPPTPLEAAANSRLSTSEEMSAYIDTLAARAPALARKEVLGHSVQGRPIEALVLAAPARKVGMPRLKVLLVGSQHGGAEPASGEAMLAIARDLIAGDLRPLLDDLDVILIPNANPDGRDLKRRANASRVNINTDFVLLSQPESRALVQALARYAPDAVLDAHESAVLKRQTLAREGYLTDFDAQFEIANNPAQAAGLQAFAQDDVLPALLARVSAGGLPANHYIGEIVSTRQPITHGGLTLRNFRNTAGLGNALSVLVETRLEPHHDPFASYRNIAVRVQRQQLCTRSFLVEVQVHRAAILEHTAAARAAPKPRRLTLFAGYAADPDQPTVTLPLRRLDTRALESIRFADHRRVVTADTIPFPAALVVTDHADLLLGLLDRHGIQYTTLTQAARLAVVATRFVARPNGADRLTPVQEAHKTLAVDPGGLVIDLAQPGGRKALLLLDPRSISSVFRYPEYAGLITPGAEFFVYQATGGAP